MRMQSCHEQHLLTRVPEKCQQLEKDARGERGGDRSLWMYARRIRPQATIPLSSFFFGRTRPQDPITSRFHFGSFPSC